MNKQSNTYIVTYATVLVVVVAAVLSFAAIELQPRQEANAKIEKMGAILGAIGKGATDTTADKNRYIEQAFETYIPEAFFVDSLGNKLARTATKEEVLNSLGDLPAVFAARTAMPVFVASIPTGEGDGSVKTEYVVPMTGKGLWGPVWGYV
ncbi:MAG: NADH:ubiquinone reductase (Na(+)-transporting) subunit C, partial [Rikenella sp.]|nr:NADH:ubiquinone reductase (Na(+)-transporting) subunit C [Rikenella sp.]